MDHSLRAYLERQTTEKLDYILQECLGEDRWKNYPHVILENIDILEQREPPEAFPIPNHVRQAWMRGLEQMKKAQGE